MKDFMFFFRGPEDLQLVRLNQSVVLAQMGRIRDAIDAILDIQGLDGLLENHYIYNAVLGSLYGGAGDIKEARQLLEKAYDLTSSLAEKKGYSKK